MLEFHLETREMLKKYSLYILLFLIFLLNLKVNAQKTEHNKGEIIVQLLIDFPASELCSQLAVVNEMKTGIQVKKIISKELNIQLMHFDHHLINETDFFERVYTHPGVLSAQYNRKLTYRSTLPDDSLFNLQWQLHNDGSTGGTIDADIDADLAWDTTRGGLTALGDTIVIAVIDDGLDENHLDFGDNLWVNRHEIPGNGIDDDLNGYMDDYLGWNSYYNDDDVFTGGGDHGTSVAGIMGAKGNNKRGVCGINWRVKLMIIAGGGDEADAIAAYSYVYTMRKMYNETNGQKGAYIVTSNASWGIDYGKAEEAPLWCAMYDSLGAQGVLNVGATANADRDVDIEGDLPSQCPSKYLIIATNTDKNDLKVNAAGYGKIHVDLGAPGKNVFTTDDTKSEPDGYGYFGGTSASAPQVTGVIALLYAAACQKLMETGKTRPDSIAFLMRKFILNGTDLNGSLINITTTQGRLNAYNAILESSEFCYNTSIKKNHIKTSGIIKDFYPNPVTASLTIRLNKNVDYPLELKIFSMLGKEVLAQAIDITQQQVDVSFLSPALYILSVMDKESNLSEFASFLKN